MNGFLVTLYHLQTKYISGFIEFLLDRTIDYSKDIKESKYEIIKKLSRSASFDNNILIRLTKYVEEGPFYSESVLQVAMEEGD